jgi:hypothetical protein
MMPFTPFFCFILLLGTYYNPKHIGTIRPVSKDIYSFVSTSHERPCLPYLEGGPCFIDIPQSKPILQDRGYIITLYGSILPEVVIWNSTHPEDYARVEEWLDVV